MRTPLIVMSLLGGCQCLQPVEEFDAGSPRADAGAVDAGPHDAGRPNPDAGEECLTAADCQGTPWARQWCFFSADAGFSCLARRCVSECPLTSRTCIVNQATECMECSTGRPLCIEDLCPTAALSARITYVECRPDAGRPPIAVDDQLSFVPVRGASCLMSVSSAAAGLGQVVRAAGRAEQYWFIRPLGGYCLGTQLPTGATRSSVACPLCSFTVEGF